MLKRDPRRITFIVERLFGQPLPNSLRQFLWTERLLRLEKKPQEYDLVKPFSVTKRRSTSFRFQHYVELQTRREFAAGVTRGKNELRLTNPSQTPVTNLIENAVIEVRRTGKSETKDDGEFSDLQ